MRVVAAYAGSGGMKKKPASSPPHTSHLTSYHLLFCHSSEEDWRGIALYGNAAPPMTGVSIWRNASCATTLRAARWWQLWACNEAWLWAVA